MSDSDYQAEVEEAEPEEAPPDGQLYQLVIVAEAEVIKADGTKG